ncbi:uncharacterized protein N7483_012757 [Penicillium malachiteum]|uniref:uncharacterized protein n=1 Tax=Penicillium malachiteum TaxID=1324776 RepID=UPI002546A47E|nr:uncharacterized protein N7483_012757 [Penicillium malachiteum]KAJ5715576.1 hypothetical protein N7483_012757 [Penicillium malachiteum]
MEGSSVFIHHGPYESIPENASPGLQFLSRFMPAVDEISPQGSEHPIKKFFNPNAPIIIDNNPPNPASSALPLLEVRSRHLTYFRHEVHIAWDMDLGNAATHTATIDANRSDPRSQINKFESGNPHSSGSSQSPMKRTVMFEATSETIFKDDPDDFLIKIREFNILDLEGPSNDDLQVAEMRIFLDARPVQARAASLQMESAFGEAQRETQVE